MTFDPSLRRRSRALLALCATLFATAPLAAQQPAPADTTARPAAQATAASQRQGRPLSLAEALQIAERQSEALRIAEAGLRRARGQLAQARSAYFPQLTGTIGYQRTIQSQFQEILEASGGGESEPEPDPDGESDGGSDGLGDIGRIFASENTVTLGLQLNQTLWTGGRLSALNRAARAGTRVAELEVQSQRAQVQLEVTQAYYDALLADRLVAIAESSLVQTERTYRQAQLAHQVGTQSEFDLLRARVTRDNQRPQLIQARTARETAYLRLAQLLELPLDEPLNLTTPIEEGIPPVRQLAAAPAAPAAPGGVPARPVSLQVDVEEVLAPDPMVVAIVDSLVAMSDTSAAVRTAVRQAAENIVAQQAQLRAARAQRWPQLQLSSLYQRFAYPPNNVPGWNEFFPNWTVSVGLSIPILTGGRISGEVQAAEANLVQAQQQQRQAEELARLDARLAIAALEQAAEAYAASQGTEQQAARAYQIAEVRFREGISSQLELNDARLLLQQAQANQAQAARDLAVARMRLMLLPNLPLGAVASTLGGAQGGGAMGGATGTGTGAGAGSAQQGSPAGAGGVITGMGPGGGSL